MFDSPWPDPGLFPGWLTAALPGTGGEIRAQAEDFHVREIPLYEPTGRGQHTLFEIVKRDMSTFEAINRLARAWNIPPRRIGMAGLKDTHAVTQQHLSVDGISPDQVLATAVPDIDILWAKAHRNRLKIGHLRGNAFAVRVRQVPPSSLAQARQVLAIVTEQGLPNGFGPQRFGIRQSSHLLGHALITGDNQAFLAVLLGRPQASDPEPIRDARALYDQGKIQEALATWRPARGPEHRCLAMLADGRPENAVIGQIPRSLRRLYLSAYQSYIYNHLVAQRLDCLGRLQDGDLAIKHVNGAFFAVVDADQEQSRADQLEISPSGALFGRKVRLAKGLPGEMERALMHSHGVTDSMWQASGARGDRRPLRVPVSDASVRYENDALVVSFTLPSGAYATNLLGEIMKTAVPIPQEEA